MLITVFFHVAVICFTIALSEPKNIIRRKRSENNAPCDRGWYYFGEKCYKIFARKQTERLSWNRASERCKTYGGDLVSIQSQEEQDFVVSFLQLDIKSWVWIGLNDNDKESDHKWTDGSVLNYTNWKPGEPSGKGGGGEEEDCVHMVFEPENDVIGKWNDRHCGVPETYVCEMKPKPRKKSPNPMYCLPEEGGGWKFQSSCYHVVTEAKSWKDAEKYCKNYYKGHLVDILDTLEDFFLDYIATNLKEDFWIGIETKNKLQQRWSSGWYVSYDGFNKEQLHFQEGTCVAREQRKDWIAIPCTKMLPFICEVSKENPPVLKPPPKGSRCPMEFDEWRDLGGEYCYYFEKEKALSFYEALFDCKRKGGSLVSLHSKEESDTILSFHKYGRLGRTVFIGLFRLFGREEEFAWTDGSEFNFENWKTNEPNSLDEKCVESLIHDDANGIMFSWNDISCADKRGYTCSVKKINPSSSFEEEAECDSNVTLKLLIGLSVSLLLVVVFLGVMVYYFRLCGTQHPKKSTASTAPPIASTNLPEFKSTTELVVVDDNRPLHYELMM